MVIKLDGLSEKEKKAQLEFAFLFPKSFELIKQEGRVEGAKEIIDLIIKQQKVYKNNLKKGKSKWLEGAVDCCNYLLQLIKEKRLKELESKGVN